MSAAIAWRPSIETRGGPRYRAIAEALQDDIAEGRLQPGERLPTHRELAWQLGVTVGTVTRAYVEAERRGLIAGEVGRGTFVRNDPLSFVEPAAGQLRPASPKERAAEEAVIDLAGNAPPPAPMAKRIGELFAELGEDRSFIEYLRYRPSHGLIGHCEAGAEWFQRFGRTIPPDRIVPTNGAQHGLLTAAAAVLRPGECLLTENLTFFGIKASARIMGLRLHPVTMDEEGLIPEALEAAIEASGAKALYTMPSIQNPTCAVMPEARRAEIAEICRRHGIVVIEDEIYSFLLDEAIPPLATFLPEQTISVTSLSKCVAPALRVGYVALPQAYVDGALLGIRGSAVMANPLMHEIAARLIREGAAAKSGALIREEARARQALAGQILGNQHCARQPTSLNIWLTLPEAWRREAFVQAAQRLGVIVASADVFAVGRGSLPHAVRISLAAPRRRERLQQGLEIVKALLADPGEAVVDMPMV